MPKKKLSFPKEDIKWKDITKKLYKPTQWTCQSTHTQTHASIPKHASVGISLRIILIPILNA